MDHEQLIEDASCRSAKQRMRIARRDRRDARRLPLTKLGAEFGGAAVWGVLAADQVHLNAQAAG
jgi:hypothetical protein